MASLDNGHNAIPRFVDLPGWDRTVGIWKIKALSSSDTVTIPELDTGVAAADKSSVRVLEPATGVTAAAAAKTADGEHVVTLAGATRDQELIMFTVHVKGRHNHLAIPDPA